MFVLCWTPLYGLYCYFFMAENRDSAFFQFASSVLRPIFQWLSLLSSSLNPLIYIAFSQVQFNTKQHFVNDLVLCRNTDEPSNTCCFCHAGNVTRSSKGPPETLSDSVPPFPKNHPLLSCCPPIIMVRATLHFMHHFTHFLCFSSQWPFATVQWSILLVHSNCQ